MMYLTAEEWSKLPEGPKKLSTAKNLMNPNLKRRYCKRVVHPEDLHIINQMQKTVIYQRPSKSFPMGRPRIVERVKEG
jgi:hypothetical protein